jgi:hypothetical protein
MTQTPEEIDATMTAEENRFLKAQNSKLLADLEEATSLIFSTKHRHERTSDVTIRDEYTAVCSAIDNWALKTTVDFRKADFRRRYEELLGRGHDHHRGSRWSVPDALSGDELSRSDNFGCFILSWEVMRWLYEKVFRHRYPIGVTREQQNLLATIEDGMESPSMKRGMWTLHSVPSSRVLVNSDFIDKASIAQWRSETLFALTAHPSFEQEKKSCAESILAQGIEVISIWLPTRNPFPDNGARLRRDFLDPALKLHLAMCTSTKQYEMSYRPQFAEQSLSDERSQHVTLRDFATWGRVKNPSDVQANLSVLYPALSRLDNEGRVEEVLAAAVLVVTLDATLLRSGHAPLRRYSTTTSSQEDGKGESDHHYTESETHLKHSESDPNLAKRQHDPSPSIVKRGSEYVMARRKPGDTRSPIKSASGSNESPERKSQRSERGHKSFFDFGRGN